MDRAKLEEAIRHARQAVPWQYGVVCDAAEAHLATLPRKVKMTVWAHVSGAGTTLAYTQEIDRADKWRRNGPASYAVVELTGEYEMTGE